MKLRRRAHHDEPPDEPPAAEQPEDPGAADETLALVHIERAATLLGDAIAAREADDDEGRDETA